MNNKQRMNERDGESEKREVETDRLHAFRKHFPAPWKEC